MASFVSAVLLKIFDPLFAVISAALVAIISKINTGDWAAYFNMIPGYAYVLAATVFALGMGIKRFISIYHYNEAARRSMVFGSPGGTILGHNFMERDKVLWEVTVYGQEDWITRKRSLDFEVDYYPRCPKCKTKLVEGRGFGGWYVWSCPSDGWITRKLHSAGYYRYEVNKIAERELEIAQQGLPKPTERDEWSR